MPLGRPENLRDNKVLPERLSESLHELTNVPPDIDFPKD